MNTRFRFVSSVALLVALLLALALPLMASAAPFPTPYLNGFENAADATPLPLTSDTDTMFGVTRVASGTNSVTSADGGYHATAPVNTTQAALFTRLGGYQTVFPAGGVSVSIDMYLDTAVAGPTSTQLDWSAAANTPANAHRRDFVFSIGGNGAGGYVMSASNNSPGWPGNPARDPYTITTTGWYTFKHVFRDNAGVLAVDMQVLDAGGTLLKSWTLSDPTDTIGVNVGGHRYAWLITNEYPDLPIDNVTRSGQCTTVCYADAVGGSDANDGITPATAKKTIQAAVTQVTAGGTVNVAAGVYAENVTIAKSLTLTGAGQTNDAAGTVLEGTGLNGSALFVNAGVTDVTIQNLRAQNYNLNPGGSAGVYASGQNHNFTVQNVTSVNNGFTNANGGGVYMNGPVDNVLIDHVTAIGNRSRGIVIWNGFKSHITITNNTVTGNNCCGIELQDGTAGGVTVTGNTVSSNADSGMAFIGLTSGAGPNLIADNTITNNGRFGIEIKLPNGTGLTSGDGSIVVEDNTVSMSAALVDARDGAGIAAYRRGWVSGNNNVDIPTGVVIRNNSVTGYQQTSTSDGFGIVVEGTNMHVSGNTLTNNDVGVQVQGGHLPYTANTNVDGNQANLADQFFGRGNSPVGCALVGTNTFTGNTADARKVGTGGMVVAKNLDTGETFCTIQAAIDDSDTLAGHTIEVYAGTHTENVTVSKKITLDGAGSGNNPAVDTIITPVTGRGLMITASGTSAVDRLVIKDLRVTGAPDDGITLEPPNGGSYLTLDNVASVGQTGAGSDGLEIKHANLVTDVKIVNSNLSGNGLSGFRMGTTTKLDGLTVENTTFDGNAYGVNIFTANTAPTFDHITFTDVTITNNTQKGIYTERLNNATFTGLTVTGNGSAAAAFMAGVDINLKYANFSNITIEDSTFENNGLGDTANAGVDLTIKVRNDGAYVSPPATLTNLNVNHNVFSGTADAAMSVGNNLDQATTAINRNAFGGTNTAGFVVFGTAPATMINAECNWWKDASGPSGVGAGSGNAVSANADFTPWLYTANLDGPCFVGGTITVEKQTTPNNDPAVFEFDPSWGANFNLSDGQSVTSPILQAGPHSVAEVNLVSPWTLTSASCDNTTTPAPEAVNPSSITLADGDAWKCTFNNKYLPLCTTVCYADAVNGDDSDGGTSPADAFKTIQKAIDTVQPGGEVRVLPGTYDQDEKNGRDPVTGGAGGNDFNIFVNKANLTIQGVTAADVDITTAAGAQATIKPKRYVPTFGSSAMFIQADGVTVQGVKFVADNGAVYAEKVVEIIGNDVTIDGVAFDVTGGAAGIYISDFSFDAGTDTSTVPDYAFTDNAFTATDQTGLAIQVAGGAGWPDNVGTRTISGNTFTNLDDGITFAGAGSAGWRLYPVGSADITGNTFSQIKRRHILAYGNYPVANPTSLGYADPDWCGIIANNTFDKGSFLWAGTTQCPAGDPRRWEAPSGEAAPYDWFRNIAGLYSAIEQYGVGKAVAGDLLQVLPGVYPEEVEVNKPMTIEGANAGVSPNAPGNPLNPNPARGPESVVAVTGGGSAFKVQAANVTIDGFKFTDSAVAQANVQSPIIGAGGNFGGDAPGVKVLNNLFFETNRMLVYFNGPVLMQGGTIDDNRAQDPGRPDTGCPSDGNGVAPSNCGYQLFNPWHTQNVSFQRNVALADPGSGDRVRTLNLFDSVDVLVADNVVRNTCTYACFNLGAGVSDNIEVKNNDLVSDVGNIIQIHSTWATVAGDINVHHNILTTGNDYPIVVDNPTADLDNVHINRNAVTGGLHARNGSLPATPGAETLDVTCNWWGSAAGPTPANFFGPNDFTPWLYTSDLDGPCFVGGTISIDKVAPGGGATVFTFDVSWSANHVTLTDAAAPYVTTPPLPAGPYTITEINFPVGWSQQSATCYNTVTNTVGTANITVADGDAWVCTFTNTYTPPPTSTCPVAEATHEWTDLLGIGMGSPKKHKAQAKLVIPNYTNLVDLYGQLVAKNSGAAKYVRFMQPGKNNYVQVSVVTSPPERMGGNFWYGADLPITAATKSVIGKWFLQKSGTKGHIPRALVLYPTYNDAANTYVNVWDTFTPAEGEVDWNVAAGWTPYREIIVPIPAPLGPETFHIELALVDNDKDARPVWVTVTAGGVTQTVKPTNPDKGEQLNLLVFDLANVPAGTAEIVIEVYSPSMALDGVIGDSAALVGMTANYQCSPLVP